MNTLSKFEKVKELRSEFNLTLDDISRAACITPVAALYWSKGHESPRAASVEELNQLYGLAFKWRTRGFRPQQFAFWLTTRHMQLGARPIDLLANRRAAEVDRFLERLRP